RKIRDSPGRELGVFLASLVRMGVENVFVQIILRETCEFGDDSFQKKSHAMALNKIEGAVNPSLNVSGLVGFLQRDDWLKLALPALAVGDLQQCHWADVQRVGC